MVSSDIVIVGTGGSGREHLCVINDINDLTPGTWNLVGFLASEPPPAGLIEVIGSQYLGSGKDPDILRDLAGASFVVGIGNSAIRRRVTRELEGAGLVQSTLIHPSAWVGPDVVIGRGSVVCAGAVITTSVRIGESCQVNVNCSISHDVVIGDFVTLTPAVALTGNVTVGDDVSVGTNACAIPGVRIGSRSTVGAGAVVTRNVRPGATVVGVPAREI